MQMVALHFHEKRKVSGKLFLEIHYKIPMIRSASNSYAGVEYAALVVPASALMPIVA